VPSVELSIAAHHPAYAGHFPGDPVLPGVVLLDEALHALAAAGEVDERACRITAVKFHQPVRPGEQPVLEYESGAEGIVRFTIRVGTVTVASGMLQT
jgi:3-hydroxyacyl-[acyl-carrier-protein] dehydratase